MTIMPKYFIIITNAKWPKNKLEEAMQKSIFTLNHTLWNSPRQALKAFQALYKDTVAAYKGRCVAPEPILKKYGEMEFIETGGTLSARLYPVAIDYSTISINSDKNNLK